MRGRAPSLLVIIYIGVGVAIAASHHYFHHVHGWRGGATACTTYK